MGEQPDALISTSLDDVLGLGPPSTVRALIGTDDYVEGASLMGLDPATVAGDELRALDAADFITAITPELAERWSALCGKPVHILPNGVDVQHYADVPAERAHERATRPCAVLMGHLSERIDMRLLESLVASGVALRLIGPHRPTFEPDRFQRLVSDPLVIWFGPREYDELPELLAQSDVGITPYLDTAFNRASYPLKTLEYLAAGLPVVSTPLPSVGRLGTDLVRQASGADNFVAAVWAAAAESRDSTATLLRQRFAQSHSWAARAQELEALLAGEFKGR